MSTIAAFQIQGSAVSERDLASYQAMRLAVPKPVEEDRHARHIQRFYACRGLRRSGYPDVFVRPTVGGAGDDFHPEVVGRRDDDLFFVYCATTSLAQLPHAEIARVLSLSPGPRVMLIVANTLDVASLNVEYAAEIASGRVSLRVMTLPPFDDVLEYDIWMFELAFQELPR